MAKKYGFRITLGFLLAFSVILFGCTTYETHGSLERGVFQDITTFPAKDFTSLGLVFVDEARVTNGRGHVFIYNELLKRAHLLGADTIINVVIDRKSESQKIRIGSLPLSHRLDETWYGSATAIRYVDGVMTNSLSTSSVIITPNGIADRREETRENIIMNRGGGGTFGTDSAEATSSGRVWYNPLTWFR
jgi:hypothetical protein